MENRIVIESAAFSADSRRGGAAASLSANTHVIPMRIITLTAAVTVVVGVRMMSIMMMIAVVIRWASSFTMTGSLSNRRRWRRRRNSARALQGLAVGGCWTDAKSIHIDAAAVLLVVAVAVVVLVVVVTAVVADVVQAVVDTVDHGIRVHGAV